jgi:hypothetical protein
MKNSRQESRSIRHGITRSIRHNNPISEMSDMIDSVRSFSYTVITKNDKMRNEAIRLMKGWYNVDKNNIDAYLKQINTLHVVTTNVVNNIEYCDTQNSMLSYMSDGTFGDINMVIDTYNDFIDRDPLLRLGTVSNMGYGKLPHINLSKVDVIVGRVIKMVSTTPEVKENKTHKLEDVL